MKNKLVSVIIVNYNGEEFIEKLAKSLKQQSYKNFEVIFVDNSSHDKSLEIARKIFKEGGLNVTFIESRKNTGFAKGNNLGIEKAKGDYLLFLNTDAFMDKNALTEMVKVLEEDLFIAGVNPKTYLSRFEPIKIFDNFGVCMNNIGSPYNRAIGQIDLGQYDKKEELFGICFACCLVRKDLYELSGGLDNSYFAYFEDVDWSFRVRKMGFKFLSCPNAVVSHYHSGTTSKNAYSWKYHLVFRNYLRTVTKSFGIKNALRIVLILLRSLTKSLVSNLESREMKRAMFKVILNYVLLDWYRYLLKRRETRKYFIDSIIDQQLFAMSQNEPSEFFDPQQSKPIINDKFFKYLLNRIEYIGHSNIYDMRRNWQYLEKSIFCSLDKRMWERELQKHLKKYHSKYNYDKLSSFISSKLYS